VHDFSALCTDEKPDGTYRVPEQNECVGGAQATPHTGTDGEEVLIAVPELPEWRFK
jgi:hypothetical protein